MKYKEVVRGQFLQRPNRFIAYVELAGKMEKVHVKNTGRCRELLLPGAVVYLEKSGNPGRSTAYDLIAVEKGDRLINMDSQAPNQAVGEWLKNGGFFPGLKLVRPETVYGHSRFDFYVETERERIFIEVKGVTLEDSGVVRFPDAPSERAVKHVEELVEAKRDGYRVFVLFVIQMKGVKYFTPNRDTHPEFAEALCKAAEAGVEILAYDCRVTGDSLNLNRPVPVVLHPEEVSTAKQHSEDGLFNEYSDDIKETLRLEAIPKPLLQWYDKNRRILPWREEPAPYRVWVSEIMLQQTRVEAVKPYFKRFMDALPDIRSLAEAEEEQLLKLWEGLGYYNRVRNLQKAAIQIQKDYGGEMPCEYEELLKLTGVGSYTAGAIASIAFGVPRPAVDGNVLRVVSRVREDERLITDAKVKKAVEEELAGSMPPERPGDFNQAMMELGACVCLPNGAPLCGECPLNMLCLAHAHGREMEFPKKEAKKARQVQEKTVLVVRDGKRAAVRRREGRGLLAGMYEFPMLEGFRTADEVVEFLTENGIRVLRIRLYIEPSEAREKYPIPAAFAAYRKGLSDSI